MGHLRQNVELGWFIVIAGETQTVNLATDDPSPLRSPVAGASATLNGNNYYCVPIRILQMA